MKLVLIWLCLLQVAFLMASRLEGLHVHQEFPSLHSDLWNQGKPRTLFARRGVMEHHKLRAASAAAQTLSRPPSSADFPHPLKPSANAVPAAPPCSKVSESCITHSRCCDPCASCHCRFFNTVCYCWKMARHCQKKPQARINT